MTNVPTRLLTTACALALALATTIAAPRQTQPDPPRLAVLLVIDQFRADYITSYGHQWSHGLKRLLDTGAVFPLAAYPYARTVTCAGHATIATGTLPSTHGMIDNDWFDRALGKQVTCTEDASVTSVPFGGGPGVERHGPKYLRVPTFADTLREQRAGPTTVVSLSQKARSAIGMAGQPSPTTYAAWIEDNGSWATSSAYATTAWPVVDTWAAANPTHAAYGQVWDRLLPPASYLFDDDMTEEPEPRTFPRRLTSPSGKPDNAFVTAWKRAPASDAAVARLAQHLVRELALGQRPGGTDVLALGFSALDYVGHRYGPKSHEVQDTLAQVDRTIGILLEALDAVVGRDRYVVALSGDHGVSPVVEQAKADVPSAGRYTTAAIRGTIEEALAPHLGEGPHILTSVGDKVYLRPGAIEHLRQRPEARSAVTRALEATASVDRVYWADELASQASTDDPVLRAARRSFVADRSGDLIYVAAPYWLAQSSSSVTTHGTPWGYDTRVPVVFAGAGIAAGTYLVPASPADIAPTLASLFGVTMARVDGRVLTQALQMGR